MQMPLHNLGPIVEVMTGYEEKYHKREEGSRELEVTYGKSKKVNC
jgi:uncharacterized protein YwgA